MIPLLCLLATIVLDMTTPPANLSRLASQDTGVVVGLSVFALQGATVSVAVAQRNAMDYVKGAIGVLLGVAVLPSMIALQADMVIWE